jgi:hypothetical protein
MYPNDRTNEELIENEKCREKEFISELKQKLDELEHYAAASGSLEGVPTSVTMEKQRVLIDQLRRKLHLQLDDASVSKLSLVFISKKLNCFLFIQFDLERKNYENLSIKLFIR